MKKIWVKFEDQKSYQEPNCCNFYIWTTLFDDSKVLWWWCL